MLHTLVEYTRGTGSFSRSLQNKMVSVLGIERYALDAVVLGNGSMREQTIGSNPNPADGGNIVLQ